MCWLNNEDTKKWFKVTSEHLKEIKSHLTTFAYEKKTSPPPIRNDYGKKKKKKNRDTS